MKVRESRLTETFFIRRSASVSSLRGVATFHTLRIHRLPKSMYGSGSFACANKSMYTERDMKHRLAHLPDSPLLADMEKHINPSNVI